MTWKASCGKSSQISCLMYVWEHLFRRTVTRTVWFKVMKSPGVSLQQCCRNQELRLKSNPQGDLWCEPENVWCLIHNVAFLQVPKENGASWIHRNGTQSSSGDDRTKNDHWSEWSKWLHLKWPHVSMFFPSQPLTSVCFCCDRAQQSSVTLLNTTKSKKPVMGISFGAIVSVLGWYIRWFFTFIYRKLCSFLSSIWLDGGNSDFQDWPHIFMFDLSLI